MDAIASEEYRELLKKHHNDNDDWGSSININNFAKQAISKFNPIDILDFGSGKGGGTKAFKELYPDKTIISFDPAFQGEDCLPEKVDMIYTKDFLEHIEPQCLDYVLKKHFNIVKKVCFHSICTRKAGAILPDGRNAHLIVETPEWWRNKLQQIGFTIKEERINVNRHHYGVILTKK